MTVQTATGATGVLTDGTGISRLTGSKVLKDLVLDACLSGAAALGAVAITDLQAAVMAPTVVEFAIGGALIRVLFRAIVRWASS